jgi:hypothetical protein
MRADVAREIRATSILASRCGRRKFVDTVLTRETEKAKAPLGASLNSLILLDLMVRPERFELPAY